MQQQAPGATRAVALTRGQLLDLVLDVEERLRLLIRAVLSQQGDTWEKLIPGNLRSALIEQHQKVAGDPLEMWRSDLLDYASLGQMVDVLNANWKSFQALLHDKARTQTEIHELRSYRNALAHGKKPAPDEKVKIYALIENVGQHIPASLAGPASAESVGFALSGKTILWADDRPENNRAERRSLELLHAQIVPVLSNDEAIDEVVSRPVDLVISDVDRGNEESGLLLPFRLREKGLSRPLIFYVGQVDPDLPVPDGATAIVNDPADLLGHVLACLRRTPKLS